MFRAFNLVILLASFGVFGISIYLFVLVGSNFFDWMFMLCSFVMFMMSICALRMKTAINWLFIYILILFALFTFMLLITIIFYTDLDKLVSFVDQAYSVNNNVTIAQAEEIIKSNLDTVGVYLMIFTACIGVTAVLGYCYRNSTKSNTSSRKNQMLLEHKAEERVK